MNISVHARINRVIGQLKGIQGMIETNRSTPDIIQQLLAVKKALDATTYQLVSERNELHGKTIASNQSKDPILQKIIKL